LTSRKGEKTRGEEKNLYAFYAGKRKKNEGGVTLPRTISGKGQSWCHMALPSSQRGRTGGGRGKVFIDWEAKTGPSNPDKGRLGVLISRRQFLLEIQKKERGKRLKEGLPCGVY